MFGNILIVGETGTGKSSIVNLLGSTNIAEVGDSASSISHETQWLSLTYEDRRFHIYDSTGLSEGVHEALIDPQKQIEHWVKERVELHGISGFIMVMKKGAITKPVVDCYNFLHSQRRNDCNKFPIIALINWFDDEDNVKNRKNLVNYWERFEKKGMQFATVIATCAADPLNFPSSMTEALNKRRKESRKDVLDALVMHSKIPGWTPSKVYKSNNILTLSFKLLGLFAILSGLTQSPVQGLVLFVVVVVFVQFIW